MHYRHEDFSQALQNEVFSHSRICLATNRQLYLPLRHHLTATTAETESLKEFISFTILDKYIGHAD